LGLSLRALREALRALSLSLRALREALRAGMFRSGGQIPAWRWKKRGSSAVFRSFAGIEEYFFVQVKSFGDEKRDTLN
jgi:hypothetical protein